MTANERPDDDARASAIGGRAVVATALLCALAYFVLVGGTAPGEVDTALRFVNGLIGGAAIGLFVLKAHGGSDRVDIAMIAAVALFSIAGLFSMFPRQSFDAVLAALAYGAVFYVARRELHGQDARRRLVALLIVLSAVLTLITAARWLGPIVEWWSGTGWTVMPPLNFELAGSPWGHRHDLALLIALLYPAWWIGRPSPLRRSFGVVVGVLALLIVLVDASRAVWLALAVATLMVGAPFLLQAWRSSARAVRMAVLGGFGLVAMFAVISGIGLAILQRATNLATLDYRTAMWGPLITDWLDHPLTGNGPGSFPWVLQLTGYFDTNSLAPRHPDSAFVMALAEGGFLGVAALAMLVVLLVPAILRSRSLAARWALIAFGVASLLANPTDFAFLIVVAIAWAAYALPFDASTPRDSNRWRSNLVVPVALGAMIAIAFSATTFAAFAYDQARSQLAADDLDEAASALDVAVALDPSMALYPRQRGAVHYMQGDLASALSDLTHATSLNSSDDLGWRTLAMTLLADGDESGAQGALSRALQRQRSDPTNLLLAAIFASDAGHAEDASETLTEVLQAWPATAFATGWPDILPSSTSTEVVGLGAIERWSKGESMPELPSDQLLWLALMAGRDELVEEASAQSGWSPALDEALVEVIRCGEAAEVFEGMDPNEQRTYFYWWLRVADAERHGSTDEHAARMAALMGHPLSTAAAGSTLNPLNENGQFSADAWGYRRRGIVWSAEPTDLPSVGGGRMRWIFSAGEAVESGGLDGQLPACAEGN